MFEIAVSIVVSLGLSLWFRKPVECKPVKQEVIKYEAPANEL